MAATAYGWHVVFALSAARVLGAGVTWGGDVGQVMAAVPGLALALFVAAVVALTVSPREPLVRLLSLLLFTCGVQAAVAPLAARGNAVADAINSIVLGLSISLFARFCLAFARRGEHLAHLNHAWYRALDRWGPLVPLVLCIPSAALLASLDGRGGIAHKVLDTGLFFGLVLGLASLARAGFHSRHSPAHGPLVVVGLGAALAGLPPLGLNLLPDLVIGHPAILFSQGEYGLLALPVCLGFALVRWRTVSLLNLVDRVSVYALLGALLLAAYGALALGLARLEGAPIGSATTLVALAVAIIVATTFAPLRDRFQRAVDTVLYRDYYDLGQTVQRFSQSLAMVREQHTVATSLLDDLCDTLNLSGAALIQLPGGLDPEILHMLEPEDLVARRGYAPLEVRRQLVRALAAWEPPTLVASSHGPVAISPFAGCAALVAIGPGSGEDMSALLLIGSKRGGGHLRLEDRALLGTIAHQAATALENATLVGGLRTTLSQLRRSTEQLEDARAELQLLLREMVDADERQRASLARDIHDVALQDVMFASRSSSYCLTLFASVMEHDTRRSPDAQRLAKELSELAKAATSAEAELRNVITGVYPAMIESLGLPSALETLAEEASPGHALAITVDYDPLAEQLANELKEDVRLHIYRIAQEAIRNASKHAHASHVGIELRVMDEPRRANASERTDMRTVFVVSISDDGRGIPLPVDYVSLLRDRHLGMASMRDRADRVGGQLSIRHGPSGGTCIEVHIRLQPSTRAPSGWTPDELRTPRPTPLLAPFRPEQRFDMSQTRVATISDAAVNPSEG